MMQDKVGRYIIKEPLGQGGMATVYRAEDPRFQREVALKILPRELVNKPTFRARFDREARIVASLEHPAIVAVYDFGEEKGLPFLVMRLMRGGSLADRLADGPLPLKQSAAIIKRLASALDAAHKKGIVHRDLKPGNILFDNWGEPYLADFGIVKIAQENTASLTRTGGIIGTPSYMSPEQVLAREELDGRSDIYALGIIFFEMLTGDLPYKADTPMGIALQHINEPVPQIRLYRADLPADCEQIIKTALAKSRDDRYRTAAEFAKAINDWTQRPAEPTVIQTAAQPTIYETEAEIELYQAGMRAQETGNWDEAIAKLTALISLNPAFGNAAVQLGHAYRQKQITEWLNKAQRALDAKEWQQAEESASQAVQSDPENEAAKHIRQQAKREGRLQQLYTTAVADLDAHHWDTALEKLEHLLDTAPGYLDAQALLQQAEAARIKQGQIERLVRHSQEAFFAGLLDSAEEFLNELQEISPNHPELEGYLAKLTAVRELQQRAKELFTQAKAYTQQEAWLPAKEALHEAVTLHPQHEEYKRYLIEVQNKETCFNQYNAALEAMEAAEWATAATSLEHILEQEGDYKNTASLLEAARKNINESVTVENLYAEGITAVNKADWSAAANTFKKLLQVQPDHQEAEEYLAQVETELATYHEREMRQKNAASLAAEAENAAHKADWSTAVDKWQQAMDIFPEQHEYAIHLKSAQQNAAKEEERARLETVLADARVHGSLEEGLAAVQRLQDLFPEIAEFQQIKDEISFQLKQQAGFATVDSYIENEDWDGAAERLTKLPDHSSDDKRATNLLAEVNTHQYSSKQPDQEMSVRMRPAIEPTEVIPPPTASLQVVSSTQKKPLYRQGKFLISAAILVSVVVVFLILQKSGFNNAVADLPSMPSTSQVMQTANPTRTTSSIILAETETAGVALSPTPAANVAAATATLAATPSPTATMPPTPTATMTPTPLPEPITGSNLNEVVLLHTLTAEDCDPIGDLGWPYGQSTPNFFVNDTNVSMWVGSVKVCSFDANSGHLLRERATDFPYGNVDTLTISPDGSMVAGTFYQDGYHLFLWDITSKRVLMEAPLDKQTDHIGWSSDNLLFATVDWNGRVRVWSAETREEIQDFRTGVGGGPTLAWSPDDAIIAVGGINRTIEILELATNEKLRTLSGHNWNITAISWSPDGTKLASSGGDSVRVWDATLWDPTIGQQLILIPNTDNNPVMDLAWMADSQYLVSGHYNGEITIWDTNTGELISEIDPKQGRIRFLQMSTNYTYFISFGEDKTLNIWGVGE